MRGAGYNPKNFREIAREAMRPQYDGLAIKNVDDALYGSLVGDVYAVKDGVQVKSPFNRGTYSQTDPNFLRTLAPVAGGGLLAGALLSPQESQAASMGIAPGPLSRMLTSQYHDTAQKQAAEADPILDPISMFVNAATGGGGYLARALQAASDPLINWGLR
jgi:hypothetical protein